MEINVENYENRMEVVAALVQLRPASSRYFRPKLSTVAYEKWLRAARNRSKIGKIRAVARVSRCETTAEAGPQLQLSTSTSRSR